VRGDEQVVGANHHAPPLEVGTDRDVVERCVYPGF
jgi:hypothetical protein